MSIFPASLGVSKSILFNVIPSPEYNKILIKRVSDNLGLRYLATTTTTTDMFYHFSYGSYLIYSTGIREFCLWYLASVRIIAYGFIKFREYLSI